MPNCVPCISFVLVGSRKRRALHQLRQHSVLDSLLFGQTSPLYAQLALRPATLVKQRALSRTITFSPASTASGAVDALRLSTMKRVYF